MNFIRLIYTPPNETRKLYRLIEKIFKEINS